MNKSNHKGGSLLHQGLIFRLFELHRNLNPWASLSPTLSIKLKNIEFIYIFFTSTPHITPKNVSIIFGTRFNPSCKAKFKNPP